MKFIFFATLLIPTFAFAKTKCLRDLYSTKDICVGAKVVSKSFEGQSPRVLDIDFSSKSFRIAGPQADLPDQGAQWFAAVDVAASRECHRDICVNDRVALTVGEGKSFKAMTQPVDVRLGQVASCDQHGFCKINYRSKYDTPRSISLDVKVLSRSVPYVDGYTRGSNVFHPSINFKGRVFAGADFRKGKIVFLAANGWAYIETPLTNSPDFRQQSFTWEHFAIEEYY